MLLLLNFAQQIAQLAESCAGSQYRLSRQQNWISQNQDTGLSWLLGYDVFMHKHGIDPITTGMLSPCKRRQCLIY